MKQLKQYEVVEVKSKMLKQIIWDKNKNLLMVKFVDSPIYVYPDAPRSVFEALLKAESKGKFFLNVIKKQYPKFVRLDN